MNRYRRLACSIIVLSAFCSCAAGPDYRRPNVADITPSDWRWKIAEPRDTVPKGQWWKVFGDPLLDELEADAVARNQDLRAAVAARDTAWDGQAYSWQEQLHMFSGQQRKNAAAIRDEVRGRLRRDGTGRDLGYPGGRRRPVRFDRAAAGLPEDPGA